MSDGITDAYKKPDDDLLKKMRLEICGDLEKLVETKLAQTETLRREIETLRVAISDIGHRAMGIE